MKAYSEFRPTRWDVAGLALDDRKDWLVIPVSTNRDADALTRSNWRVVLADVKASDPTGEDVEVHRFGHWACGWFEIAIVRQDSPAAKCAADWENALSDYPVASGEDFAEEEQAEANEVWRECYRPAQRVEYIRRHRSQFEFSCFADMLGCVRGDYFAGYASELLS